MIKSCHYYSKLRYHFRGLNECVMLLTQHAIPYFSHASIIDNFHNRQEVGDRAMLSDDSALTSMQSHPSSISLGHQSVQLQVISLYGCRSSVCPAAGHQSVRLQVISLSGCMCLLSSLYFQLPPVCLVQCAPGGLLVGDCPCLVDWEGTPINSIIAVP